MNALANYFKEVGKIPLLTDEEERELRKKASSNAEALEKLVKSNLRLVVKIAKEYLDRGLSFEDLIGEGNRGIMEASQRYIPKADSKFITYASWWINHSILKAISESSDFPIPPEKSEKLNKVNEVIWSTLKEKGYNPRIEEIAKRLGLSDDYVKKLVEFSSKRVVSLNQEDEDGNHYYDAEDKMQNPEMEAVNNITKEDIKPILERMIKETLSKRERSVIEYRSGFNGSIHLSLEEVGEIYHVSRSRIGQIEKRALKKMRRHKDARILQEYL